MRIVIAASAAATAGLIAAGMLGVATAEAPTGTPPRTVSVEGVATEAIGQSATAAAATAVYRQGMTDAVGDGLAKAQFLASKVGATVGAAQSVVEGGGYISCVGEAEYLGEQPDFGSPGVSIPQSGVTAPTVRRGVGPAAGGPLAKHRKARKSPTAKKATVSTCSLSTQVSLSYLLS
jgi:hypothetical protein